MIRKLLLPLVAVALLGGCVSYGYSNRHGNGDRYGNGDYYYGAPSVDYRYHSPYYYGSPYAYYSPYSYYGGRYSYYSGPYGYGYPYGGYYGYYGGAYPYYGGVGYSHYYTPRRPSTDPTPDRSYSPWRDLDQLRRRTEAEPMPPRTRKPIPQLQPGQLQQRQPQWRQLQPRRAPVEAMAPSPQPRIEVSSQPRSAPAPRSDGSSLSGMVRRVRVGKGDPSDETTP
jgi:hypothetical protein